DDHRQLDVRPIHQLLVDRQVTPGRAGHDHALQRELPGQPFPKLISETSRHVVRVAVYETGGGWQIAIAAHPLVVAPRAALAWARMNSTPRRQQSSAASASYRSPYGLVHMCLAPG